MSPLSPSVEVAHPAPGAAGSVPPTPARPQPPKNPGMREGLSQEGCWQHSLKVEEIQHFWLKKTNLGCKT